MDVSVCRKHWTETRTLQLQRLPMTSQQSDRALPNEGDTPAKDAGSGSILSSSRNETAAAFRDNRSSGYLNSK
ncbi:hypothetical protein GOODEAATRI_026957 [Goodea atripinnis]|uniref:Uncharacterized protein n=1 Tax=Goodea atripinnis TaxID=208336 RepID=A0ABV0PS01_9TELE